MDFIRYNLISKILTKYRENRNMYNHDNFFYFENNISKINRIGKGFLYNEEEIMPLEWQDIKGKELLEILKQMNQKNFFFYKNIDGKFYKTRPKKRNVKE